MIDLVTEVRERMNVGYPLGVMDGKILGTSPEQDVVRLVEEIERLTDDTRLIGVIHDWLDDWKIELRDNEPFYDLLWRIKGHSSDLQQEEPMQDDPTVWVRSAAMPCGYLTANRHYRCKLEPGGGAGLIINDSGDETFILLKGCGHLKGGDWEIVGGSVSDSATPGTGHD